MSKDDYDKAKRAERVLSQSREYNRSNPAFVEPSNPAKRARVAQDFFGASSQSQAGAASQSGEENIDESFIPYTGRSHPLRRFVPHPPSLLRDRFNASGNTGPTP